jgi:hypothetical protein
MPTSQEFEQFESEIENSNKKGLWLGTISIGIMAAILAWIAISFI